MTKSYSVFISVLLLITQSVISTVSLANEPKNQNPQTGAFQITTTITEVGGPQAAEAAQVAIAQEEPMIFEIYVPKNYRPEAPAGLMVYVSPSPSGKIPNRWKKVLDEQNIIWIAANDSGNKVAVARRAVFAMVAPSMMKQRYRIDGNRVYLSGFSGGGKVASMIAPGSTNVFKGAIYTCGVEFWEQYLHDDPEIIRQYHYVFITGTEDFNKRQTRNVHKLYKKHGVENSKLMIVSRMGHRNPPAADFNEAIQFLDSRLASEMPSN
jgi:hypothetical protein